MENWKDVKGYEDAFEVSSLGRIRGKERTVNHVSGERLVRAKDRKLQKHNQGYLALLMRRGESMKLVHRLVAEAFIPNPEGKDFINHRNGNKRDNRVENLEWVTRQENEDHAFATGLKRSHGEWNPNAKLRSDQVHIIRELIGAGYKDIDLAVKYGVSARTINRLRQGLTWKTL